MDESQNKGERETEFFFKSCSRTCPPLQIKFNPVHVCATSDLTSGPAVSALSEAALRGGGVHGGPPSGSSSLLVTSVRLPEFQGCHYSLTSALFRKSAVGVLEKRESLIRGSTQTVCTVSIFALSQLTLSLADYRHRAAEDSVASVVLAAGS